MNDRDVKELEFFRKHMLPAVREIMQEVYEGSTITEAEDTLSATLLVYDENYGATKAS